VLPLPGGNPIIGDCSAGSCADVAPNCADLAAQGYCGVQWAMSGKGVAAHWCRSTCRTCGSEGELNPQVSVLIRRLVVCARTMPELILLLHGLLDGPRALPMATDKLGSFKNIL
jgi:hypothetical protein